MEIITHKCDGMISPNGGYCEAHERVLCPATRSSNGAIFDSERCGEPCDWIMGKAGHGNPPWEVNADGTRRNPQEPDNDQSRR